MDITPINFFCDLRNIILPYHKFALRALQKIPPFFFVATTIIILHFRVFLRTKIDYLHKILLPSKKMVEIFFALPHLLGKMVPYLLRRRACHDFYWPRHEGCNENFYSPSAQWKSRGGGKRVGRFWRFFFTRSVYVTKVRLFSEWYSNLMEFLMHFLRNLTFFFVFFSSLLTVSDLTAVRSC